MPEACHRNPAQFQIAPEALFQVLKMALPASPQPGPVSYRGCVASALAANARLACFPRRVLSATNPDRPLRMRLQRLSPGAWLRVMRGSRPLKSRPAGGRASLPSSIDRKWYDELPAGILNTSVFDGGLAPLRSGRWICHFFDSERARTDDRFPSQREMAAIVITMALDGKRRGATKGKKECGA